MATIIPFPVKKVVPIWGLTEQECNAVQAVAYDLILEGHARRVSVHNDRQYMCVLDANGEPYSIGREEGVCYLTDPDETMLTHSRRFEIVLQALQILLTSRPDGTA
jgi:hypothetical protein